MFKQVYWTLILINDIFLLWWKVQCNLLDSCEPDELTPH